MAKEYAIQGQSVNILQEAKTMTPEPGHPTIDLCPIRHAWRARSIKPGCLTRTRGIQTRPQYLTRELLQYLMAQVGAP